MLSLDKTKDISALVSFLEKAKDSSKHTNSSDDAASPQETNYESDNGTNDNVNENGLLLWKLDGLSIVLRYANGQLKQALTRGNGQIGEDVTHNARVFANIPQKVPYTGSFSVRGEAVITFADFEAINTAIENDTEKYKNPRNLCSGTVRQLNSEVASKRRVFFYAFGAVFHEDTQDSDSSDNSISTANQGYPNIPNTPNMVIPTVLKSAQLEWLAAQGFDVVAHKKVAPKTVADTVENFKSQVTDYPIATDGLVLTYDDIQYSESLGATSKFPRDSLAFKWADDILETVLTAIEWNPSRTGLINPVAIFEPVEIEGSVVSRASLHNVSILRGLELGIGDKIKVYKANMIIPQVAENLTRSNTAEVPVKCPTCGGETEVTTQRQPANSDFAQATETTQTRSDTATHTYDATANTTHTDVSTSNPNTSNPEEPAPAPDSEVLICTNPACSAKQMQSLAHFVSRDGLNIEGLSEQTLEKLLKGGLISSYSDIFTLSRHEEAIIAMEGLGRRSYEKLLKSIEKAKDVALPNFIYALGIRHVGLANAKLLCAHFNHDFAQITTACQSSDYQETLAEIKGFGDAIAHSLNDYFSQESNLVIANETIAHLNIKSPPPSPDESNHPLPLKDLIFVITGDVQHFANRKALQAHIESLGGKVTGSVTAKTSYLINNDAASNSSKNKKAAQLGVPVITEDGFMGLV